MMPPIPTVIMLPTETAHGYWPATVVAAIPLGHGNVYAVTAIDPSSPPAAPAFVAAEVTRNAHGSWFADEATEPGTLRNTLGRMCDLAGLAG